MGGVSRLSGISGLEGHMNYALVVMLIWRGDHWWPILADRSRRTASNGFSHEWPRRTCAQHRPQRGLRLRQRDVGVTMLHLTGLFRADPAIQASGEKMNASHSYSAVAF